MLDDVHVTETVELFVVQWRKEARSGRAWVNAQGNQPFTDLKVANWVRSRLELPPERTRVVRILGEVVE